MEHIKIKIKFKHIVIAALVVVAAIMLKCLFGYNSATQLLVNAGLTPQERAQWEYKTKVGVAEALAKSSHHLFLKS